MLVSKNQISKNNINRNFLLELASKTPQNPKKHEKSTYKNFTWKRKFRTLICQILNIQ